MFTDSLSMLVNSIEKTKAICFKVYKTFCGFRPQYHLLGYQFQRAFMRFFSCWKSSFKFLSFRDWKCTETQLKVSDLQKRKCVGAVEEACSFEILLSCFVGYTQCSSSCSLSELPPNFSIHYSMLCAHERTVEGKYEQKRKVPVLIEDEKFRIKLLIKFHDESCYKMLVK